MITAPELLGFVAKVTVAAKVAVREPELIGELVQLIVGVLLGEQEMPPVQLQLENCQPVEGVGRFAVTEKLLPHSVELCPLEKLPLQALIEPGEEAPRKLAGSVSKVTAGSWENVAETVTALLGIVNVQGLPNEPPEHDAPVTLQLENCQPELGVAVTEIVESADSAQPLGPGQFGITEPDPASTSVAKVCVAALLSKKTIWPLLFEEQEPKLRLLVSTV